MIKSKPKRTKSAALAGIIALSLVGVSCNSSEDSNSTDSSTANSQAGLSADEANTINVAVVDNPEMKDIESLTPDNFTAVSGIKVNFVHYEEQALKEQATNSASKYDVVMVGSHQAPQFGSDGWLDDLTTMASADTAYDVADLIPSVKGSFSNAGKMYAVPIYAESSFLAYRKDLADAAGVTIAEQPTWAQVAAAALKLKTKDMAGICLRGKPGWGELGSTLTTMVNTFGGTWWDANADGSVGKAQINTGGFKEAFGFYSKLLKDAGEPNSGGSSFIDCLGLMKDSKAAMWYDATVASQYLEAADSRVKGKIAYALAPVNKTQSSGWLWSWGLGIAKGAKNPQAAWKFMSWATSKDYIKLAGTKLPGGWPAIPPGSRISTYSIPEYVAALPTALTLKAIQSAPIDNPGTSVRPGFAGIQYVGVPEFGDIATKCTEQLSLALGGTQTNDQALNKCQELASTISK